MKDGMYLTITPGADLVENEVDIFDDSFDDLFDEDDKGDNDDEVAIEETGDGEDKGGKEEPTPVVTYGRTGLVEASEEDMETVIRQMTSAIKRVGFYETMACLASACERVDAIDAKERGQRAGVYSETAKVVDRLVKELTGGRRVRNYKK